MSMDDLATTSEPALARFVRTAAALQASPEFIEKLPVAIYACDAKERLLWYNARAAKLWGRTPLIGEDVERCFCGSYKLYFGGRPRDKTPMAAALRTGIAVRGVEELIERPDGSQVWCMVHIEPVDDNGAIVGAINCFHETPAPHRAEEMLHEQHEQLAVTYEHAGTGIAEVDANGILLRVNARLCGMMGFSAQQLQGRSIFDETFPEDRERDRAQFLRQTAGEIDRYTIEKRIRRSDGSYVWVSITSASVRDGQGEFLYAVRVQTDIDDRKRTEERLARRMDEQAALYGFTERLQHAESLRDVYEPALDAITRALRCSRASILLFDETGVMRFVAWRGLSETYRRAVDGHSPWTAETRDPQPISLADIEAAGLPDELTQAIRAENIGALAFIPLTGSGRLLGKFMAYFDAPHAFTDEEIDVAVTLARQLGLAVQRMRTEAARREAERAAQQLAAIVESSDDAIYSEDPNGIITTWNRGAAQLFGYAAAEAIGRPIAMLIPHDRRDEEAKILAGCRAGERLHQYETVRQRKDGSLVEISLTVSPMCDARGRLIGVSKIARDITERKQGARAALQLASIVASSDDAIISKDLDGVITTWNQGAERIFGYTAAEAVGRPVTILFPQDRFDEEPSILARIRAGERIEHYETVRRRKDGSLIDISLTVSPMKDARGRTVGASKIARDITERKHAEARLRDSERRLQELLAAIPAAIYTTDALGRVTYYNEAAVELAGRTPVVGSDQWCVTWKLYWPDGRPLPHDQCPMAVALKEGRAVRGVEAVAERPDGTRVPFIPYPTPLRDAGGNIVGAINMLIDISERKQAETHQRVLLNELNHRVKNNMQMMQSLLDGAAKQVRGPEERAIFEEAGRRVVAMAAAQRVLYSTISAIRFDADEVLAAVCRTVQETFLSNVTVIREKAYGELSNDVAMPLALILNELMTNAVKYGKVGGRDTIIRVGLIEKDGRFTLYVEDDGPGFDLAAIRNQSSGLRLVEGLARQLRGQFEVSRNPSRCSLTFSEGGVR